MIEFDNTQDGEDISGGPIKVAHRSTSATKAIIRSVIELMMSNSLLTQDKKTIKFDEDIKELVREIEVVIRTNMLNYGNEVAEQVRSQAPAPAAQLGSGGFAPNAPKPVEQGNRSMFLLRLIAGRFSHLFADPNNPVFPREVVMGFDNYLMKLLGEVLYGELNVEAEELLSNFSTDEDDGTIWKEIGKNDRHKRFAYNILIRILLKFEDFEWAKRNFISILNNVTERQSGFLFEDQHFQLLFTALFSDLFKALWDDEESLKLDFMFGEGTADRLDGIRDNFKTYKEQLSAARKAKAVG